MIVSITPEQLDAIKRCAAVTLRDGNNSDQDLALIVMDWASIPPERTDDGPNEAAKAAAQAAWERHVADADGIYGTFNEYRGFAYVAFLHGFASGDAHARSDQKPAAIPVEDADAAQKAWLASATHAKFHKWSTAAELMAAREAFMECYGRQFNQ